MVLVEAHDKLGHQGNSHTYCLIKRQHYWKGMNKDIRKYIANCILCHREKAKVQHYPLQMMEIPNRPFDRIAIDLNTECNTSTSDNKHILTIIDHLTGWPEAFPIPNKNCRYNSFNIYKRNTYQYTCAHSTSYQITECNSKTASWTKSYNNLELTGYFQHHTTHTVMGKSEVFHKYLKPTLKKLCEKDPTNWNKYLNQVLTSYRITPNLATAETPFFLVYGRETNLPLHQLLEPMQHFLGDPDSGMLNLETHRLALAIAKKTLDGIRFKTAQKIMAWKNSAFQVGDCVYIKNRQPGKWDLK